MRILGCEGVLVIMLLVVLDYGPGTLMAITDPHQRDWSKQ